MNPPREKTSKAVRKFCNQVGTTLRILREINQSTNRAEIYIGLLKEEVWKDLNISNSPLVIWDYCSERRDSIHNLLPRDLFQKRECIPYEYQFGTHCDISNLCNFSWYEWCYYQENGNKMFPKLKNY